MVTPELLERTREIWKEDQWARRTVYASITIAFAALGIAALGNIGLGFGLGASAVWMSNNAINYFN